MKTAVVFLADGFEECEGLLVVDLLRRAGIHVITASVMGRKEILSSHQVTLLADACAEEVDFRNADVVVLPGGMPGTLNLQADETLAGALKKAAGTDTWICAICAAPRVLGHYGLLEGQTATCYPGCESYLTGAQTTENPVEVSGQFITSRGVGTAIPFALKILEKLEGAECAQKIEKSIVFG